MDEKEFDGLKAFQIVDKIINSGESELYLKEDKIKSLYSRFKRKNYPIAAKLIEACGKVEEFLTPEKVLELKQWGVPAKEIASLILLTKNFDKYKFDWQKVNDFKEGTLSTWKDVGEYEDIMPYIIKATGDIELYLTKENVKKYGLNGYSIAELIRQTRNIDVWLANDDLLLLGLEHDDYSYLIKNSGNISQYLDMTSIQKYELDDEDIAKLAIASGRTEEFLQHDMLIEYGLNTGEGNGLTLLIKAGKKQLEFLTLEKYLEVGGISRQNLNTLIESLPLDSKKRFLFENQQLWGTHGHQCSILNIIKGTGGNVEEFIKNQENLDEFGINFEDVRMALPIDTFSAKEIELLKDFDVGSIQAVLNASDEDRNKIINILKELSNSNSGELRKIKGKVAFQILNSGDDYKQTLKSIEDIYLTDNLPEVAKRYLVFRELHPGFIGERDDLKLDASKAEIPSFQSMNPREREHFIFSDLLWCSLESNDRNLRDYLDTIERGNNLFEQVINNSLNVGEMDKKRADYQTLSKYASIVNTLYNLSSKMRHVGKERKNTGDLEFDLRELNTLFNQEPHIHLNLADRIVKTFGYWAGITSLKQAKEIMDNARNKAHERNVKFARKGDFRLEIGDFAKGIKDTQYIQFMLQKGIVSKDFLGGAATHNVTPMDMDVEKVIKTGDSFEETFGKMKYVSKFTDETKSPKNIGSLFFVFSGSGMIETRSSDNKVNESAVEKCLIDKRRKECFFDAFYDDADENSAQAYGIRTGLGSGNIKYMIALEYNPKLGLEIALNGFYIPIVNQKGELIYTPEMYEDLRNKMQGLSHFGETHYIIDSTANNELTEKISELVSLNRKDAEQRRSKIVEVITSGVEQIGLSLSDERKLDLTPGIVELIDTGSTGRGTNEPGDGDFDFMVRLDRSLMEHQEPIREMLRKVLSAEEIPDENTETGKGDFRYKGVSIPGISKKADIDLTFMQRTNEIEYSTEESVKDRLNTIRQQSEEDYNIVVANILLAKKYLKMSGAYKKGNAPAPEEGQMDTRGGLGAVGIENWILQNGGSFEKASRDFLQNAGVIDADGQVLDEQEPVTFKDFQDKYYIWDFGENWTSVGRDIYPHDNFVNNMTEEGYQKMVIALKEYVLGMNKNQRIENTPRATVSMQELVEEDSSISEDKDYIQAVEALIRKSKDIGMEI